jgi:hypothetical protein
MFFTHASRGAARSLRSRAKKGCAIFCLVSFSSPLKNSIATLSARYNDTLRHFKQSATMQLSNNKLIEFFKAHESRRDEKNYLATIALYFSCVAVGLATSSIFHVDLFTFQPTGCSILS